MSPQSDQNHDNLLGSMFMLLAMAGFAIGDAILKLLSTDLPLSQILVIRGAIASFIMALIVWYLGQFQPPRVLLNPALALRVIGELIAAYFFLNALFNMPIANAAAILQALPLTVTLGAAIFLGEVIGWRRIMAILIGFLGVLLIVQPGLEGFNAYAIYCVIAVFGTTLRDLATRRLPEELPSMFVALVTAISVMLGAMVLSLFQDWQPVTANDLGLLAMASIFLIIGFFCIVRAMRVGEVAVVTPYRYSVLLFALLLGIFLFNEYPDGLTIVGSLIVVASGLYTFYRERYLSQKVGDKA